MTRNTSTPILLPVFFFFATLFGAFAHDAQNLNKGLAVEGYDVVAYFSNKVVKGKAAYSHTHEKAKYLFSSEENLNKFKASPAAYIPQYGGYCAYALSQGKGKVNVNPENYKIIDGKLYLYFSSKIWGNTLKKWNKGKDAPQVAAADKAWVKEK